MGDLLFFAANDGVHGNELWKSDGTAAGTKMVKNIRPYEKSSNPTNLVNVNGTLFFTAVDGVHGNELWKSDGTKAGTVLIKDANTGGKHSYGGNGLYIYYGPVAVGNKVFFAVQSGGVLAPSLWVSDGTAAGTHDMDAPILATNDEDDEGGAQVMAGLGNQLFFVADGDDGNELWATDGTDAGTQRVAGSPSGGISILPAHGQSLYFAAYDYDWDSGQISDVQLWKTNGTAAGTTPLTAIGQLGVVPSEAAYMAKRLYFDGRYRTPSDQWYIQLWKTDGTTSGTKPILTSLGFDQPDELTAAGGRLFFRLETHLWKSDGTAAGTKDMGEFGGGWPRQLVNVAGTLCFNELDWDAGTWSLWESEGTKASTYEVGTYAGTPDAVQQAAVNSRLFFAANDLTHGMELWSYTP